MKLLMAATVFVLAGCAASGVKVSDAQVATLKKGETTKADVLRAFGPPTTQTRVSDGTSMVIYSHFEVAVRPATFIPIVGAFAGGSDTRSNTVLLRFDADDKLIDSSSSETMIGTGNGLSAAPIDPVTGQPRKQGFDANPRATP